MLLEAVRRNPVSRSASDAEMENVMSKWLRFAGDRSGERQRRTLRDHARAQSMN